MAVELPEYLPLEDMRQIVIACHKGHKVHPKDTKG